VRKPKSEGVSGAAWLMLGVLILMMVLSYLDRGLISLLVKPIRESLGVSDVQISLLYGMAFGLFYATFSFPLGWLADRWSRRGVIFVCITLWSLATGACGLANSFWALAVARFAVGFGEGGLSPAAYRMIGEAFPKRRMGLALGLFGAGAAVASPLALVVGGRLVDWATRSGGATLPVIGHVEPWQLVFLVLGPPGVVLAPLIFLAPSGKRAAGEPAATASTSTAGAAEPARGAGETMTFLAFIRSRWLYLSLVLLGFGFVAMFSYAIAAWTPTYFQRHFGLSMGAIGASLALVIGASTAFSFIGGGWITDRWFARGHQDAQFRYSVFCLPVVVSAGVLAFGFISHSTAAFAVLSLVWLFVPSSTAAAAHLQHATPLHLRGRVMALFTMVFNIVGMTTGPLVVALLTEHVFHDPGKVGLSIAVTLFGAGSLAFLLFAAALGPARRAIAAMEASA
jgi:MFS family permease